MQPLRDETGRSAQSKSWWKSKSYGVNLLVGAASEFTTGFGGWVKAHPQTALLGALALNMLLRHWTKHGVHYGKERA